MHIPKVFLLLMISLFTIQLVHAQQKKPAKKNEVTPVQKFKAPKLHTALDSYNDSTTISPDEAARIIGLPLKIYDDKKVEYSISSYQFMYKKAGVTEDEQTGKLSPTTTMSSERFKVSPLPELWINIIREQVKAGEEFYFFDVIAKDAHGRVMYAPTLKITIR